jgi:hypothetical protein
MPLSVWVGIGYIRPGILVADWLPVVALQGLANPQLPFHSLVHT